MLGKAFGCLQMYEAAQGITIQAQNQYHMLYGFATDGCNNGITFTTSATGTITDTEDNGSGDLRCTDVAHGLTTGQYISLVGMGDAAHVGLTAVTVIGVDTYDCDDIAYNSDNDTGNWIRGSSLKIDQGHGGVYSVSFAVSLVAAGANQDLRFEISKNATMIDDIAVEDTFGTSIVSAASGTNLKLVSGDVVTLLVNNTTSSTNLTISHANMVLNLQ